MKKWIRRMCAMCVLAVILLSVVPAEALQYWDVNLIQEESVSAGVQNIVKRARQMTQIQWTPQANITGWGGGVTYYAGLTYTGLPYGQPVYASYVPWSTSLAGFMDAVNDPTSLMYTSYSSYNKQAPYYSIDCSAFVSWAWGLSSRQTTTTIHNFATKISDSSYEEMEIGDCLCKSGVHVVLITDITYDSGGEISAVEVSEATTSSANYLCHSVWYGMGYSNSLADFQSKYLDCGYILYRSNTRDSVTYTHYCCVPLDGDECTLCQSGADSTTGTYTAFGIDVSHHQGTIDWDTVVGQIDFAIIRCGYGSDITSQDDQQWTNNAEACTRLGIPFGVYIYSYALTDEQALSEAEHVLRLVGGYDPSLPIYLDLEDSTILSNCSTSDILRHTQIFCETIEAAGYTAGVYANYNWWTSYLTSSEYDQWDRWIARYASTTGYSKDYIIWQYSSSGSINGISGNVDLNYWYGQFPPTGETHEHSYSSYVSQEPTCTTPGVRTYACDCGDSYTETIPATGHSYISETMQPTCTAPGLVRYTCSSCGENYTESIPALGHDYEGVVTEPDCENGGYTDYTCSRCASSYRGDYTDALGHSYVDGVCSVCGAEDPEAVVKGDLNDDGAITSADSVMLARYLAGLTELTETQLQAADLNSDGAVSSADAVMLAKFLAGVITEI